MGLPVLVQIIYIQIVLFGKMLQEKKNPYIIMQTIYEKQVMNKIFFARHNGF